MFVGDSDKTWRYFGEKAPYFGVLTLEKYRNDKLTGDAKDAFFDTGKRYVNFVVSTLRDHLDVSLQSARGLDFGCGVGRLTIPFARVCKSVVGVDVSEAMLAEARKNCHDQGISNATFARGDDKLSMVSGPLEFIHSFIVFQHIPPKRGEEIFRRMIALLMADGIGVVHFTCSWATKTALSRRLLTVAYEKIPLSYAARNLLKGKNPGEPMMQMNRYNLNRIFGILHESGCHRVHVRFTETGYYGEPFYGVILFFQKHRLDVRAHG